MITHSPKSLCKEAELYYYDFLYDESRRLIPEPIISHIEQCLPCREQINHLEAALLQADGLESGRVRVSPAVATMLELHFAYTGKPVTCNIAKPFLPTLPDQVLGIHIPTPIVAHVCDCQQCSEDLDVIRCLNLRHEQLCRLSRLFADKSAGSNISCTEAQNAIPSIISMAFSETDSEVLKHLCTCPVCRKLVYKERQKFCDSLPEYVPSPGLPCESVSASDFFDYVIPYGIDPAKEQYSKFRESFSSHVTNCPKCLAKTQELHKAIYRIPERAESDVVTIYQIDESAKTQAASGTEELYAGFPIRVDVKQREEMKTEQPVPNVDFAAALKQKVSVKKLKPLLKTAIATAAVISIAAAMLLNIPTAKAVTLERIYKAIKKARNVHTTNFAPDKTKIIQETWVSLTLNIYLWKSGKELVLLDIPNKVRKGKQADTAVTETTPLTTASAADIEEKITGSLGLMPYAISDVPEDAVWSHVADLADITKSIEVYDLTWTDRASGGPVVLRKWRIFADSETNLPRRIEWYVKSAADSDYIATSVTTVEYLSNSEMQKVIKDASF
ncbi:MAG: hypothetical protein PHQ35_08150 [Phycisphaerae bacterium]|nr:hypothetical protein [Phycisphaerae bacterium]MDD5380133.1 hypothetical protein [Phycisphaerae bacterium]